MSDETKEEKKSFSKVDIIKTLIASIIGVIGIYTVIYYIYGPGVGYLHSDCTDTMYWAKASYDSGKIISDDFRYAAILPFGGNLLMLLYMPLFGFSITTHNLGMLTFLMLLTAFGYLAGRTLGLSVRKSVITISAILLTVSASDKMREIFWGHVIYYSLGILLLFVGIVLLGFMQRKYEEKRLTIWHCIGVGIFFALVALDGGQMLVLVTVPLLGAVFLERFLDTTDGMKLRTRKNMIALVMILVLVCSVPVGLIALNIIRHGVIASYANTYSNWVGMADWSNNLLKLPTEWFKLFGLEVNARMPLFSIESVGNLIRLFAAIVIAVGPVFVLFQYPRIKNRNIRLMTLVHFAISAFILVGYICGMLATANWRLSPMIVTSLLILCLYFDDAWKNKTFSGRVTVLALVFVGALCILNAFTIRKMDWNYNRDKDVYQLSDFLEEQGLDYGYATFWNSQLITMYSAERVKARNMLIDSKDWHFESYQSEYSWENLPEGQKEYFVVFSKGEYAKWLGTPHGIQMSGLELRDYEIMNFVILVYDANTR